MNIQKWFDKQRKVPSNTNLNKDNLRMITLEDAQELYEDGIENGKEQALEPDPCEIKGVFEYEED